jgi:hypothetical protein
VAAFTGETLLGLLGDWFDGAPTTAAGWNSGVTTPDKRIARTTHRYRNHFLIMLHPRVATSLAIDLIGDGLHEDASRRTTLRILRVWSAYVNLSLNTKVPFLKGVKPRFLPGSRQSFLRPLKDTMWLLDHGPLIFLSGP